MTEYNRDMQPQNAMAADSSRFDPIIAHASHESLLHVGNLAHQQACYQLVQAQNDAARLQKEVDRLAWNRCVNSEPSLSCTFSC